MSENRRDENVTRRAADEVAYGNLPIATRFVFWAQP